MCLSTWCGVARNAAGAHFLAQSDGVALLLILHQLFPEYTMPKYNAAPKMEVHKLDNLALVFKLLEAANVKLESVNARSILEGNEKSVMGLIWTLIKEFEL